MSTILFCLRFALSDGKIGNRPPLMRISFTNDRRRISQFRVKKTHCQIELRAKRINGSTTLKTGETPAHEILTRLRQLKYEMIDRGEIVTTKLVDILYPEENSFVLHRCRTTKKISNGRKTQPPIHADTRRWELSSEN